LAFNSQKKRLEITSVMSYNGCRNSGVNSHQFVTLLVTNYSTAEYVYAVFVFCTVFVVICWAGRGGASIYGKQFDDEISDDLKHTGLSYEIVLKLKCELYICT